MIKPFSFTGARKIVFGTGSFEKLAEHIEALQGRNPLIVLDKNLAATGFNKKVSDMLEQPQSQGELFSAGRTEPLLELVDEGAKFALKHKCDLIVGHWRGERYGFGQGHCRGLRKQRKSSRLSWIEQGSRSGIAYDYGPYDSRDGQRSYLHGRFCPPESQEKGRHEQSFPLSR
jgi:hypothetical protein